MNAQQFKEFSVEISQKLDILGIPHLIKAEFTEKESFEDIDIIIPKNTLGKICNAFASEVWANDSMYFKGVAQVDFMKAECMDFAYFINSYSEFISHSLKVANDGLRITYEGLTYQHVGDGWQHTFTLTKDIDKCIDFLFTDKDMRKRVFANHIQFIEYMMRECPIFCLETWVREQSRIKYCDDAAKSMLSKYTPKQTPRFTVEDMEAFFGIDIRGKIVEIEKQRKENKLVRLELMQRIEAIERRYKLSASQKGELSKKLREKILKKLG